MKATTNKPTAPQFIAAVFLLLTMSCRPETPLFSETRKAAEQGHAEAQYNLGAMYAYGLGVMRDDTEAVKWIRKAAEQGGAKAQYNLGSMYDTGQGVTRDYAEAYVWFSRAVAQGDTTAKSNLDKIGTHLTSEQIANAQKKATAWKLVPQ